MCCFSYPAARTESANGILQNAGYNHSHTEHTHTHTRSVGRAWTFDGHIRYNGGKRDETL